MFRGGKPAGRYTPGLPPGAAPASPAAGKEDKKKRVRTKRPQKETAVDGDGVETVAEKVEQMKIEEPAPQSTGEEGVQKKIRGLNKKVSSQVRKRPKADLIVESDR